MIYNPKLYHEANKKRDYITGGCFLLLAGLAILAMFASLGV